MWTKEEIEALEAEHDTDGTKETIVITIGQKQAFFAATFEDIRKAYSLLLAPTMNMDGGKPNVSVDMDLISAGVKILNFSFKDGDESIRKKPSLKMRAAQKLANWVLEMCAIDEDEDEEKKS